MEDTETANGNHPHDSDQSLVPPQDQIMSSGLVALPEYSGHNLRQRSTSTKLSTRLKKEYDSQKKLFQELNKLLDMAKYELEVDAYRGISSQSDGNSKYGACHELLGGVTREQIDSWETFRNNLVNEHGNGTIDLNLAGICPSVQSWAEKAMEKQLREEAKKIKRRKLRKISVSKKEKILDNEKRNGTTVDDNISIGKKGIISSSNGNNDWLERSFICVTRDKDPSYSCPCDFNPNCLASIGGPMDTYMQKALHTYFINCSIKHYDGVEIIPTNHIKDGAGRLLTENDPNVNNEPAIKVEDGEESSLSALTIGQATERSKNTTISAYCEGNNNDKLTMMKKRKSSPGAIAIKQEDEPCLMTDVFTEGTSTNQAALIGESFKNNSIKRHKGDSNGHSSHPNFNSVYPSKIYDDDYSSSMVIIDGMIESSTVDVLDDCRERILVDSRSVLNHLTNFVLIDGDKSSTDIYMDMIQAWHLHLLYEKDKDPSPTGTQAFCLPCGMRNLGATCYLNSQFQCLASNPVFLKGVFSWNQRNLNNNRMNQVLSDMQLLLGRMIYGAIPTVCTDAFSTTLGLQNDEMQDPNEFSRLLFDRMHESFQKLGSSSHDGSNHLHDLLPRLFRGICVYNTECSKCRRISKRKEEFMDLTLPLINIDHKKAKSNCKLNLPDVDVQLCLDKYLESEKLEGDNMYFCDNCRLKCDARRQVEFYRLPPVLNIQLARYVFDLKTFRKQKLMGKVLLPHTLYVPIERSDKGSSKISSFMKGHKDRKEYLLCAIQNHRGTSAYGGHYVAEAMDWATGMWFEYDDENVVLLSKGPNSSFIPEVYENNSKRKHKSTRSNVNGKKIQGTSDAYNLFYVERSFLAKSAKEQINDRSMATSSILCKKDEKYDITVKVTKERIKAHRHKTELHLREKKRKKRLQCRKLGIEKHMFQQYFDNFFMASSRMHISKIRQEKTSPYPNKTNSDCKVWVDGRVLRRFMSCEDTLDDILLVKNGSMLRHKHLLCKHGTGLHPRIACQGKVLSVSEYAAYASLLCGERVLRLREEEHPQVNTNFDCEVKRELVNDCIITTDNNLFCEQCVKEYRDTLCPKVRVMKSLLNLYHALDPKNDIDFDAIDTEDENGETGCYAVSRSFVSCLRNIALKTMKDVVAKEKLPESNKCIDSNTQVISDTGIDSLNLNSLFSAGTGNSIGDSIDMLVNSKITCEHNECSVTNKKRLVRHVSPSIWKEIKQLFPNAIEHKRDHKAHHIVCKACLAEKDRKIALAEKLYDWAVDSMNDNMTTKPSQCIYLVPKREFDSWLRASQLVVTKYRKKKGKEISMGEMITRQIYAALFEPAGRNCDIALSGNAIGSSLDLRAQMRQLTCKHCLTLAPISIVKEVYTFDPSNKINDFKGPGEEAELMNEVRYLAYISSMLKLESLLNPSKNSSKLSILTSSEMIEMFKWNHPRIIVEEAIKENDGSFEKWNERNFILQTLQRGGEVRFDPSICKDDQCCIDAVSDRSSYQAGNDVKGMIETEETESVELETKDTDKHGVVTASTIEFNVHDFDESYDIQAIKPLLQREFSKKDERNEDSVTPRRSSRTRAGKRGRMMYTVNIDEGSNLARLRLQIIEKTVNKAIVNRQLAVFEVDSNGVIIKDLDYEYNEKPIIDTIMDLRLKTGLLDNQGINLLAYYNNNSVLNPERSNGKDDEEILMADLIQMADLSESQFTTASKSYTGTTNGKRRQEERGFQGTFLQSAVLSPSQVSKHGNHDQDVQDVRTIKSIVDDTYQGQMPPLLHNLSDKQIHEIITINENNCSSHLRDALENKNAIPNIIDLRYSNDVRPEDIVTVSMCDSKGMCNTSPCHLIEKSTDNQVEKGMLEINTLQLETTDSNNNAGKQDISGTNHGKMLQPLHISSNNTIHEVITVNQNNFISQQGDIPQNKNPTPDLNPINLRDVSDVHREEKELYISESVMDTCLSDGTIDCDPPICQQYPCTSTLLAGEIINVRKDCDKSIRREEGDLGEHLALTDTEKKTVPSTAIMKFHVYDFDNTHNIEVIQSLLIKEFSKNEQRLISHSSTEMNCCRGRSLYTVSFDGKKSIEEIQQHIFDKGISGNIVNRKMAVFTVVPKLSKCFITTLQKEWYQMPAIECLSELPFYKNVLEINVLIYDEYRESIVKYTAERKFTDEELNHKPINMTSMINSPTTSSPKSHTEDMLSRLSPTTNKKDEGDVMDEKTYFVQRDVTHKDKGPSYLMSPILESSNIDRIKYISNVRICGKLSLFDRKREVNQVEKKSTCQINQTPGQVTNLDSNTALGTRRTSYSIADNQGGVCMQTENKKLKSIDKELLKLTDGDAVHGKNSLSDDKHLRSSGAVDTTIDMLAAISNHKIAYIGATEAKNGDFAGNVSTFDLSSMSLSIHKPLHSIEIPPLPSIQGPLLSIQCCEAQFFISKSWQLFLNKNKGNFIKKRHKSKKDTDPCIYELIELLPKKIQDDKVALNFYRNFVEFEGRSPDCDHGEFPLSRREMDIIIYFILEKISVETLHSTLIPYRDVNSLRILFDLFEELQYHVEAKYVIYKNHVKNCVGNILEMEQGEQKDNITTVTRSKYDLSPSALATTKPIYAQDDCIPQLLPNLSALEILEHKHVVNFIESAKNALLGGKDEKIKSEENEGENSTPPLSTQRLLSFLPEFSRVHCHARNLYRNFVDSQDPIGGRGCALLLSRREMDIILYFLSEGKSHKECQKILLPYRKVKSLENLFNKVKESNYLTEERYMSYMEHVKKYVAIVYKLEKGAEKAALFRLPKYDLSPKGLETTKSRYDKEYNPPNLPPQSGKLAIMTYEQVNVFMKKAKSIFYNKNEGNFRTKSEAQETSQTFHHCMQKMLDLLPEFAREETHARNLYRNFVDSPDPIAGEYDQLHYSRRELDIILYALSTEMDISECYTLLLPYRELESIERLFKLVGRRNYVRKKEHAKYMDHVKKSVRKLVSIERGRWTYDDTSPKTKSTSQEIPISKLKQNSKSKTTPHRKTRQTKLKQQKATKKRLLQSRLVTRRISRR